MSEQKQDLKDPIERYKRVHLRGVAEDAPLEEKFAELERKKKRMYLMLFLNLGALVFFGYSFYAGQTQMDIKVLYAVVAVVILNLFVMYKQLQQVELLKNHLKSQS
jgi:hypothetical protein